MIYLLYGSDTVKSRSKLHELVAAMLKKKPDASHVRISDESYSDTRLEELIGTAGLFSEKAIIEADNLFRNKEIKETVSKRIKDIAESENIFIFLEGELDKKTLEKFEKYAVKIQECGVKAKGDKIFRVGEEGKPLKNFNMFSLTDAFGRRDKKNLWVLYTKASKLDVPPEEIHGLLFWQVKAILLAVGSKSPKEAGLNPFVYQKSLGFARNYSESEMKAISSKLVKMYHDARRGIVDFSNSLEKFILEV